MTSCTEIVRGINKIPYFDSFLYFFHDIKGSFIGIGMGNTDNLLF